MSVIIARNLVSLRINAGYETATDAAKAMGVPVQTLIAHESCAASQRVPKAYALYAYAKFYGVTMEAIMSLPNLSNRTSR